MCELAEALQRNESHEAGAKFSEVEAHDQDLLANGLGEPGIDPAEEALCARVEERLQQRAVRSSPSRMKQYTEAVGAGDVPPNASASHPSQCLDELLAAAAASAAAGGIVAGGAGGEAPAAPDRHSRVRRHGVDMSEDMVNNGILVWVGGLKGSMALMVEVRKLMDETHMRDRWLSLVEYWEPGYAPLSPDAEGDGDADILPPAPPSTSLGLVHWDSAETFEGRKVRLDKECRVVYAQKPRELPDGTHPGRMKALFDAWHIKHANPGDAFASILSTIVRVFLECESPRTKNPPPSPLLLLLLLVGVRHRAITLSSTLSAK